MATRYRKHPFSPEVVERLKECHRLDNWHGPLAVLEDYGFIAAAVAAPYVLAPWFGWLAVYLLFSVPMIACRMRALATLLHESSHLCLARSRGLNRALGTFASGYLIAQTWAAYFESHVLGHHTHLGDPVLDPDLRYHIDEGLYDEQPRGRFVWSYLVKPLLLLKTPSKLRDLVVNRLLGRPGGAAARERLVMTGYLATLAAALTALGFGRELVLFWAVPFLTLFPVVNWFVEMTEHYPLVFESDLDVHMSRNRWTGSWARWLLGVHNEYLHLVHHLRPRIPFWNLPRAHRVMMADPVYAAAQRREIGFFAPVLDGIPSIIGGLIARHPKPGT